MGTPDATRNTIGSGEKTEPMKRRFILYRRKRGGMFYLEDTEARKQERPRSRAGIKPRALLLNGSDRSSAEVIAVDHWDFRLNPLW